MKTDEKIRLMSKYRIESISGASYGSGFLDGLKSAENFETRRKVKESDVSPPTDAKFK